MEFEFDSSKNQADIVKHGIDMAVAANFDLRTAQMSRDTRRDYSEERTIAYRFIGEHLHALVFTIRGSKMRLISLRKANQEERDRYHGQT